MGKFSWLQWLVAQVTMAIVFLVLGIKKVELSEGLLLVLTIFGWSIVWGFIAPKIFKEMDEL